MTTKWSSYRGVPLLWHLHVIDQQQQQKKKLARVGVGNISKEGENMEGIIT